MPSLVQQLLKPCSSYVYAIPAAQLLEQPKSHPADLITDESSSHEQHETSQFDYFDISKMLRTLPGVSGSEAHQEGIRQETDVEVTVGGICVLPEVSWWEWPGGGLHQI